MDIVRNADGTLVVPVQQERHHEADDTADTSSGDAEGETKQAEAIPTTRVVHPGEGGYDGALAQWDRQQNPDRAPAVSTASGRQEAMALVHAVASSPDHEVRRAVDALEDPEASAEALRHVLVGGVHSVEDFASEIAEAEGGDPLPARETTKIIGEVLAEPLSSNVHGPCGHSWLSIVGRFSSREHRPTPDFGRPESDPQRASVLQRCAAQITG
jgi:hypothetical protein